MKIVISDYPDVLGRDLEKEYVCLHEVLPEAEIVIHPHTDAEAFFREMQDADGLDVLEAEKPNLADCGLLGRENVIVTPHAAFYSARSMEALQQMTCRNLTDCLTGNRGHAFKIVNNVAIS